MTARERLATRSSSGCPERSPEWWPGRPHRVPLPLVRVDVAESRSWSRLASIQVVVLALVLPLLAGAPASAQARGEVYRPPVYAEVIDPFRPPDQPWLAGNRGLEYDTAPGTVVAAIGSGLVVFAGPVAGHLYVTVLHGDGIRSSYSYLAGMYVNAGDRVRGGQEVGITGDVRFHLGARIGDTYIDPASLFGAEVGVASVFLVPIGGGRRAGGAPGASGTGAGADAPRSAGRSRRAGSGTLAGSVLATSASLLSNGVSGVLRSLSDPDP